MVEKSADKVIKPSCQRHCGQGDVQGQQARGVPLITFPVAPVVGIISVLSVITLRQDFAGSAGADAASFVIAGKTLVAIHKWTFRESG